MWQWHLDPIVLDPFFIMSIIMLIINILLEKYDGS